MFSRKLRPCQFVIGDFTRHFEGKTQKSFECCFRLKIYTIQILLPSFTYVYYQFSFMFKLMKKKKICRYVEHWKSQNFRISSINIKGKVGYVQLWKFCCVFFLFSVLACKLIVVFAICYLHIIHTVSFKLCPPGPLPGLCPGSTGGLKRPPRPLAQ